MSNKMIDSISLPNGQIIDTNTEFIVREKVEITEVKNNSIFHSGD